MAKTSHSFIRVFPSVLGREYCQLTIDRFEADERRHPSTVGKDVKREDPGRTGTILFIDESMDDWQDVVLQTHTAVKKAVTEYAKDFPALAEHLASGRIGCRYPRIERVDPGQGFDWHADNARSDTAERIIACLLYLSDIEDGGYTEFEHQNTKVKPEAGKIVVFPPFWTHIHRGVTPVQANKYTMSFFWVYLDGEKQKPTKLTWRQRLTGRLQ